ncbi:glycoside hydrolase, partial [Achaetomium macrosporum]
MSTRFSFRRHPVWLLAHLFLLAFATLSAAFDAPPNLRKFYDAVRAKGQSSNELATGFYSSVGGPNTFGYCGDHLASSGIIHIQGRNGSLANMDVDCDGVGGAGDDHRCRYSLSPDVQYATTFRDVVAGYNRSISDLNPYVHSYVVFGNAPGTRGGPDWRSFDDPLRYPAAERHGGGMSRLPGLRRWHSQLSAAAPGCAGTTGSANDILVLGFTGPEAVPGPDGADWAAKDAETFERSLEGLGKRLLER